MQHVFIFVDNLGIGGYQRLALDEAYEFSDSGFNVTIWTLEFPRVGKSFQVIEDNLIKEKGINIQIIPSDRIKMLFFLKNLFASFLPPPLIISHSLRATFVMRLLKARFGLIVNTKIHQIPRLSDPLQRLKRFFYCQFTDNLFCFSFAVSSSWYQQFRYGSRLLKTFSKDIKLLKNGVYLKRIPELSSTIQDKRRVIFLGRLTFWKGLDIFQLLADRPELSHFEFIFVIPNYQADSFATIQKSLGERLTIIEGKSFGDLSLFPGDVHIYPAQYGNRVSQIESISINCLEMACLGIPSVVTVGGQLTWSEPIFADIFYEVDWKDLNKVVLTILEASDRRLSSSQVNLLRECIYIQNEIKVIVSHF